jgi:hypothetical protein
MEVPEINYIEYYRIVRGQLEHEDDLVSNRLSWFIASQSFLFTAYAVIAINIANLTPAPEQNPRRVLLIVIPAVAAMTCLLTLIGIISGVMALHRLRKLYDHSPIRPAHDPLPPVQGYRAIRWMGLAAPLLLPVIFMGVWLFLFIRRIV